MPTVRCALFHVRENLNRVPSWVDPVNLAVVIWAEDDEVGEPSPLMFWVFRVETRRTRAFTPDMANICVGPNCAGRHQLMFAGDSGVRIAV